MRKLLGLLSILSLLSTPASADKIKSAPEFLETNSGDYLYMSDAAYFPAEGDKAVIWVPGFIFNKESWFKMAKTLQGEGVASLAVSGKTANHVRSAVQQLARRGHLDIVLVGGSSGAAAVLNAMEQVTSMSGVSGVVMLSAVRGNPIDDSPVRKLFIVSKDEKSMTKVQALYDGSQEPKELVVLDGKAHAQFMLFGKDKAKVTNLIKDFILQQ